jgi:hypothetical protein
MNDDRATTALLSILDSAARQYKALAELSDKLTGAL